MPPGGPSVEPPRSRLVVVSFFGGGYFCIKSRVRLARKTSPKWSIACQMGPKTILNYYSTFFIFTLKHMLLAVNDSAVYVGTARGGVIITLVRESDDAAQREVAEIVHLETLLVDRLRTAGLRPVVDCVAGSRRVSVGRRARVGVTFRDTDVGRRQSRLAASCIYTTTCTP